MADENYSASELRQRYHRGGSEKDSDLSAAQLRSRYGIASNTQRDAPGKHKSQGPNLVLIGLVVAIVVVGGIVFFQTAS